MIKNFLDKIRGITILGVGTIISHGITGIFWLYLAKIIEVEQYGEITYYVALAGFASIISMLGTGNAITVYSAKEEKIQSTLYFLVLISSTIAAIALFVISSNGFIAVNVVGFCIFSLVSFELLGRRSYKKWTTFQITQKIFMITLAMILNYYLGTNGIILGIGISYFPLAIPHIINVFRENQINFNLIKPKRGFLVHNYILEVARSISNSVDKIIVVPLLGFTILANYQLSLQILTFLWVVPSIVYQYILPLDALGVSNKKIKIFSVVIVTLLSICVVILAPIIIPNLFPKFLESIQSIQIVSLSVIPNSIYTIYVSKFLGKEKSNAVLISSIIYVIVQTTSIVFLGTTFGIIGIASSIVISSITQMSYMVIIDRYNKKIKN